MKIDFDEIERRIDACESDRILQEALAKLESENSKLTAEEAIVRLLIELPVAG